MQTKIRRVIGTTQELLARIEEETGVGFNSPAGLRAMGGDYKGTGNSLPQLVWDLGNYYKHRDEWIEAVWRDKRPGEDESGALKQSRRTRRSVERLGIKRRSGENMRTAFAFFGIAPGPECKKLAEAVQEWGGGVVPPRPRGNERSLSTKAEAETSTRQAAVAAPRQPQTKSVI
jgi:hypothetical protein